MNKKSLQKKIGANIKTLKEAKGIAQQTLASMCDSNRSRLEAGNTNPTIYTLHRISLAIEIGLKDLTAL